MNVIQSSVSNLPAGTYRLQVSDNTSCGGYDTLITLSEPDMAVEAIFIMKQDTVQLENGLVEVTFSNQSTNASSFQWVIDGDTLHEFAPTVYFTESGNFDILLIANAGNCQNEATQTLVVLGEDSTSIGIEATLPSGMILQKTPVGYTILSTEVNWMLAECKLVDMNGKVLNVAIKKSDVSIEVDLTNYSNAVYLLSITENGKAPIVLKLTDSK